VDLARKVRVKEANVAGVATSVSAGIAIRDPR
jgi:hypothetical protein